MHFTCRSFIGSPSTASWSQFWEIEPEGSSLGHLFGLINLYPPSERPELSQLGHLIISKINDLYYQPAVSPAQQLKKVVDLIASEYPLPSSGLSLYLLVSVGSQVYLTQYHTGLILLHRQSQISLLTQNSGQVISGPSQADDTYFLSTQAFIDDITLAKIKTTLVDPKIQNIEENLLSSLFSLPDQAGSAAVLIQVNPDNDDSPPQVVSTPELTPPQPPPLPKLAPKPFLSRLFRKKPIYITSHETNAVSKRKKINLIIALSLLAMLSVSSYFGYQKNQRLQVESSYQKLKINLLKNLTDAQAVKNLNLDSAQELARQGLDLSRQMANLHVHPDEVSNYQAQLKQLLSQTGSTDSWQPTLFHDLSLIDNQPQYTQLLVTPPNLVLLDPIKGRLDSLGTVNKNRTILATGDQLKKAISLCQINDKIYFTDDQGIYSISHKIIDTVIQFSAATSAVKPISLQSWNQTLYLLDAGTPTVWKFTPNNKGFDNGQIWLKDTVFPPNPSSLAINGSIWVLFTDGHLTPYLHGQAETTYQSPSSIKLLDSRHLVAGANSDILAFTDSDSLVYLFHKNGQVIAKYNFNNIKINSLGLDETNSTLYVLGQDQKIYQIKY